MQTQLLQMKMREQKDNKTIEQLERKLKEAGVKQLLLKTRIKETTNKRRDRETSSINSDNSEIFIDEAEDIDDDDDNDVEEVTIKDTERNKPKDWTRSNKERDNTENSTNADKANHIPIIDIDGYKSDDEVNIIEDQNDVVEINETDDDEKAANQSNKKDDKLSEEPLKGPRQAGESVKAATKQTSNETSTLGDSVVTKDGNDDISSTDKVQVQLSEETKDIEVSL